LVRPNDSAIGDNKVSASHSARMSIFRAVILIFAISQLYWAWHGHALATRLIPKRRTRLIVSGAVLSIYGFLLAFYNGISAPSTTPVHLTPDQAFFVAPFLWWTASSVVAFLLVLLLAPVKGVAAATRWIAAKVRARAGKPEKVALGRRLFLERSATLAVASPFVAGAYGLLYGRLNLETTAQPIRLARLPRAFEGFRIAQLSDIHIGPFMPAEEIRKYVAIANALKPDLTVVTGDFVIFDPATEGAVVDSLSGLRAPFGVFGCLGNHDAWAGIEDSITALLLKAGIRMLRGTNVPIAIGGEQLNLIGVDFQTSRRFGRSAPVARLLGNIEGLVSRDHVNILLSHNPDTFDRAAELGIELSLAGHTHGGQAALEFISPEIAPSRLVTPYVAGLFQKPGGRLYVNRGIGTIGIPIRIGAPPEITVYQLTRG
jgi:predicted MPP superfamily phosphohydrolase